MQKCGKNLNTRCAPGVLLSPTGHTSRIWFIVIFTIFTVYHMSLVDIRVAIQLKDKWIALAISHDLCGYFVHIFISVNSNKNKLESHAMSCNFHTNFGFRHFPQREDLLVCSCRSWRFKLALGLATQTNKFKNILHWLDHPWNLHLLTLL